MNHARLVVGAEPIWRAGRLRGRRESRRAAWSSNRTRKPPADGTTHWSTRRLANKLVDTIVARGPACSPTAWNAATDPNFEEKAAASLYLIRRSMPVFCVDEKPFKLSTSGVRWHAQTQTGAILGKTAERHTSDEFVSFLDQIVSGVIARFTSSPTTSRLIRRRRSWPSSRRTRTWRSTTPPPTVVAQSSGALVRQGEAGPSGPRHLHLRDRSRTEAASVHHQVQRTRETRSLGVCGSKSAHCITLEMIDTVH